MNEVTWELPGCLVRTSVSLFPVPGAKHWWTAQVAWFFPGTWSARRGLRTMVYWQGNLSFSELFTLVRKSHFIVLLLRKCFRLPKRDENFHIHLSL